MLDELTQIPSRKNLTGELQRRIESAQPFALIHLGLNDFKFFNEAYGSALGDRILQEIAQRCTKASDYAARLWGDTFAMIIDRPLGLDCLCRRIDGELRGPIKIDGVIYSPSTALGAVSYEPGDTIESIQTYADEAQVRAKYHVKELERKYTNPRKIQRWFICDRAHSYLQLNKAFVGQLANPTELALHYQPIVELKTLKPVSYEALIRWHRPGGNAIAPPTIIDICHRYQLGVDFCLWTIEEAQRQWQRWGRPSQRIAVNASPHWLQSEQLRNALSANEGITLEITEDQLIASPAVLGAIADLKKRGIYCTLDDFGSKYAVLAELSQINFDALKLDIELTKQPRMVGAIAAFIYELGLPVHLVAEGIESKAQLDYCRKWLNYGQGYLFGKPLPGHQLFT